MQETGAGRIRKRDRLLAWLLVWFTPKKGVRYLVASVALMFLGALLEMKYIYFTALCSIAVPFIAAAMIYILAVVTDDAD
jgi:hypothetical protein